MNGPAHDIRRFISKSVPRLVLPAIVVIGLYIYLDPFKVIFHYSNYYENTYGVDLNRDFISTEKYLRESKTRNYQAFILGNSRSRCYEVNTWAGLINVPTNKCYHFDAYSESISGIEKRAQLIAKTQDTVSDVLIIMDEEVLKDASSESEVLFIKHPELTDRSRLDFHLAFFKAFGNPEFLGSYIKHRYRNEPGSWKYDPVTNELSLSNLEKIINSNPDSFYSSIKSQFPETRNVSESSRSIHAKQLLSLQHIAAIFKSRKTSVKIVINPMYDQIKINAADLQCLQQLFGKENVFDFSGVNKFTLDYTNYYDGRHYRTKVSEQILEIIYNQKKEPVHE
jgi:hypothetical protein